MAAKFSIGDIVKATGGTLARETVGDTGLFLTGISTDTRTLSKGEAFFALQGENHDAHDHLSEAAAKGAALLVVSKAEKIPDSFAGAAIVVGDTLRAYQELAAYHRKRLDVLVIAVTGSVGKTTLKDMIACILSEHVRVHSTKGNLNNLIGLPRTILEVEEDTEALVLEMGLACAGDIERLAGIALPDIAVITNIGMAHRENFDSDDGIMKAKYEITAFLGEGGTLVIDAGGNGEFTKMASDGSHKNGFDLIRVAWEGAADMEAVDYIVTQTRLSDEDAGVTLFEISKGPHGAAVPFAIPLPGVYAGISAAMASAACAQAGVSLAECAKALANLKRTPHRLELARKDSVFVIDDTYNASPDSARSGLDYLKSIPAKRRIAVMADMNELGCDSEAMHREVGAAAARSGLDRLYLFGDKAKGIADGAEVAADPRGAFEIIRFGPGEKEALIERLIKDTAKGDAVYIKGSRAMKMEEVVRALAEEDIDDTV